jgi:hypothetical protein
MVGIEQGVHQQLFANGDTKDIYERLLEEILVEFPCELGLVSPGGLDLDELRVARDAHGLNEYSGAARHLGAPTGGPLRRAVGLG